MENKFFYLSILSILIIFPFTFSSAQYNGNNTGISVNYSYTNTSKLFLNPDSPDEILRAQSLPLDDIFSYSAELRYRVSDPFILGLRIEYIKKTITHKDDQIPVIDATFGYRLIPVEFSVYYFLPFSTESFKFFMGGGIGVYFGENIKDIGDVHSVAIDKKFAFGIQVEIGMDYIIWENFSARFQMRFRDPEFEIESRYSNDTVNYNGKSYFLSNSPFITKTNIDGITFTLGIAYNFNI